MKMYGKGMMTSTFTTGIAAASLAGCGSRAAESTKTRPAEDKEKKAESKGRRERRRIFRFI